MEKRSLYEDIALRTNGDIYIGVVGPVRCGKSTFITQFMKTLVLPNIVDKNSKQRTIDELPQSADGKTIMTTQPRFVPNEAVKVSVQDIAELNVRLIDCVGYMVDGAIGTDEGEKPRLVKTPWTEEEIPFEEAAELGTKKVIEDHSTIAIALTCDGSISDIPRSAYVAAEERVISELKENGKTFVLVLNSRKPDEDSTKKLAHALEKKYDVPVTVIDALNLEEEKIDEIFENVLNEFPVKKVDVLMPDWMRVLPFENEIISSVVDEIRKFGGIAQKIGEVDRDAVVFSDSDFFEPMTVSKIKMGEGIVELTIVPKQDLFYRVLSSQCGAEISDDYHLISYIKQLSHAKTEYDKIKTALDSVAEKGYGIVTPHADEMTLEDPQIVKQGSKFGVKLKASAPSLHIMRVDIETEIQPLVGTEQQSEDLVKYLMSEFDENPQSIWETNMFGKSLHALVGEGIASKISSMPVDAQKKMRKTLGRIVNEGKGGVICILL